MAAVRIVLTLLMMLPLLPQALAQYGQRDEGQYTIVAAQYGTAEHHVDVTNQLKQMARQDRMFIMGNRTFGIDPDPGRVKVLRIYATDPNSRERMFEFRENTPVNGAMFRGWQTGEWGNGNWSGRWEGAGQGYGYGDRRGDAGQYLIQRAVFGTHDHHVDVTDRLKQLASHDVQFRMDNHSLGADPEPGRVKTLRIYAQGPDGRERTFNYREGSIIDGSMFRGWQTGEWGNDRRDRPWGEDYR